MQSNRVDTRLEALLAAWCGGDAAALDALLEASYRTHFLPRAKSKLGRSGCRSLVQPSDLIHRAYLRLRRMAKPDFVNCDIFFAFVGEQMKLSLIDLNRGENAQKRGGGTTIVSLHLADEKEG